MANDYEYVYNGITLGGSTVYAITDVEGLTEPPDIRDDISQKYGYHGGFTYMDYYAPRRIILTGNVSDPSTFETSLLAMRTAIQPQAADLPLVFKRPGVTQQRVNCKPLRLSMPMGTEYNLSFADWSLEFVAQDPLIYDDTISTQTILANAAQNCVNGGTFPTFPHSVVITGPGTTFRIRDTNVASKELKLNTTLTAGQTITIDFQKRTILKNDGTNLYSTLDLISVWWPLVSGTTNVTFNVVSGSTGATQVVFNWRSAWN